MKAVLVVFALIVTAALAANWGWWLGFNDGADTMLCAESIIANGNTAALRSAECQRIKGKSPPPDIFGQKAR